MGTGLSNYTISYVNGSLTVNGATLTITATNASKTYGAALTPTAFTTSGLQGTDTVTSVTLTSAGSAATATVAGSPYSIVPSAAVGTGLSNYSINYVNGSLTVNTAPLTITATNASKVYGNVFAGTAFTTSALLNGDTVTRVTLGGAGVAATATVAGSPYALVPSAAVGSGLANYTISYANGSLTVIAVTLTITANSDSKTYGQTKTYGAGSAAFTSSGLQNGETAGTVTITASGGVASTAAAGIYTLTPSALTGGTFTVSNYSIVYVNGTLTVAKAGSSIGLITSGGQLIATVAALPPGVGIPTGTVQFLNGGTVAGSAPLVGATAVFPGSAGAWTAVYTGDVNFNASTSSVVTIYPPATSSLSLTSNVNPSTLGQAVTFTATVAFDGGAPAAGGPRGTVQFFDGATLMGSANVSNNQAVLTTSTLAGGTHTIFAQYSGDPTFPTASATYGQTVSAAVTMSLTAAPAGPVYGQAVVLTANVSATVPAGFTAPTGQVTFSLPGVGLFAPPRQLGTATLTSGTATLTVNSLSVGTQTITALYGGDATWRSASAQTTVTVSPASTNSSVSLAMVSGQLTLTGVVAAVAPGAGTPTGSIQFVDTSNNQVVASATLSSGKTSATVAANLASAVLGRPIAAVYSGDGNFNASTSSPLPALVNSASSFSATFAVDEIASIFGVAGLNGDTSATLPLPTSLGGVTVNIVDSAGTSRPALLYGVFGSAGQINLLIPGGTAPGPATVTITLPGAGTVSTVINIANTAPGIFTANMTGQGPYAGQEIYVHADGSQTVANSAIATPGSNGFVPNPINLGTPGDQVFLVLYGTGLRHATSVTATVNGVSVPVAYSGPQGTYAGLDQINVGPLPANLTGAGTVNVVITTDGQAANPVTVAIR